jgi:hypothetical protein
MSEIRAFVMGSLKANAKSLGITYFTPFVDKVRSGLPGAGILGEKGREEHGYSRDSRSRD